MLIVKKTFIKSKVRMLETNQSKKRKTFVSYLDLIPIDNIIQYHCQVLTKTCGIWKPQKLENKTSAHFEASNNEDRRGNNNNQDIPPINRNNIFSHFTLRLSWNLSRYHLIYEQLWMLLLYVWEQLERSNGPSHTILGAKSICKWIAKTLHYWSQHMEKYSVADILKE
jgi:hypothetical protein